MHLGDLETLLYGLFGGVAGSLAVALALSRWVGSLWLGRLIEREKARLGKEIEAMKARYAEALEAYKGELARSKSLLQAEIDRSVFVTRAQFETEFDAFKQVFGALAEVRLYMASMRPMLSISSSEETEDDRRKSLGERLRALAQAYDKAVTVVENLSAFYPKELYVQLLDCLRTANLEMLQIRTSGNLTFTPGWYEQGQKRMDEFLAAYSRVSDTIRERISKLAVIPRS